VSGSGVAAWARATNISHLLVTTLQASVRQALDTEAVKSGLAKQSFDVAAMPQSDFVARIKADTERWGSIVKASGFKPLQAD
jgi:tripartite-type tricarboxylate transporter receptor subunit TctC